MSPGSPSVVPNGTPWHPVTGFPRSSAFWCPALLNANPKVTRTRLQQHPIAAGPRGLKTIIMREWYYSLSVRKQLYSGTKHPYTHAHLVLLCDLYCESLFIVCVLLLCTCTCTIDHVHCTWPIVDFCAISVKNNIAMVVPPLCIFNHHYLNSSNIITTKRPHVVTAQRRGSSGVGRGALYW